MQSFSSLKQEFLKNWIKGLQICSSSSKKKKMGLMEKKNDIKFSADLAMASARKGRTCWSRAIIAKATEPNNNNNNNNNNDCNYKSLAEHILGPPERHNKILLHNTRSKLSATTSSCSWLVRSSKKILKRSRRNNIRRALMRRNGGRKVVASDSIAKRLMEKRVKKLKSIVPGGELIMDEVSLIEETLDYLVALRAQVDVMRLSYACANDLVNGK